MFFEDPYQAFSNIYKSLKSISFVCWQNPSLNLGRCFYPYKLNLDLPSLLQIAGPFAFEDKNYISDILQSNFKDIEIQEDILVNH